MQKTSLFELLTEAIPSFYKYTENMPNMKIHLRPEALFFVQYDPKATWFNQLKPAFR